MEEHMTKDHEDNTELVSEAEAGFETDEGRELPDGFDSDSVPEDTVEDVDEGDAAGEASPAAGESAEPDAGPEPDGADRSEPAAAEEDDDEETGEAVMSLWKNEKLSTKQVWRLAYEDGGGKYLPRPVRDADFKMRLPEEIWREKYEIITGIYGFSPESFEAKSSGKEESFWCLNRG